ncbi:MAG TPA: YhfC family glutamic-type intramembrane protease [Opitutaceae bacterium]|nr:YhfC family glutamic-type intramembrane protease [Opitutaceae bacterium]
MSYLVYFAGPFFLGIAGAKFLRQRTELFFIGVAAFLVTWAVMQLLVAGTSQALGLTDRSFLYGVLVAVVAGIFEESTRHIVFQRFAVFRTNRTWRASLTYAFGHHGMETVIVGATLLLITLVLRFDPGAISNPATLRMCQELDSLGGAAKLYNAVERLAVGLLIHACFSAVVMLGVARGQLRWLLLAIAWHFGHDLVGFNLGRIAPGWIAAKAWVGIIIVAYSYAITRLWRALSRIDPANASSGACPGPSPLILPGRPI